MRLTCAPNSIYKNLITKEAIKPAIVTPESVFQFYCSFYQEIFSNACPCLIQDSPFSTVETFQELIIYMMVNHITKQDLSIQMVFPGSPYGYPLLLTADNVIRCFDQSNKVIRSKYYDLFPNSLSSFLHEQFLGVHMHSKYFMVSENIEFIVIKNLLKANLSWQLHQQGILNNNADHHIELENLERLWNCLTSDKDPLLRVHQESILKAWALTPATDECLYSTNSDILPILPLRDDYTESESFRIFSGLGLPTIDSSINCKIFLETCALYFPSIKSYDRVLSILYHLHQEQHIFDNISECSNDILSIFKYFQKTGFIHNQQLKTQILSLPLFKPKKGSLTSLLDKKVYLWPPDGDFCEAGYNKWAPAESVVFLDDQGDWRQLMNDISVIGKSLEEKEIYLDLILPCFSRLSTDERRQHLEYILELIYPIVKNNSEMLGNNKHVRQQRQEAQAFLNELRALKCIECHGSSQLRPVSDFSDHTSDIFNMFSDSFIFLPEEYRDEKWFQFFCDLGLQTTISAEKFINFCFQVKERSHNISLTKASSVLLKYLFDKGQKASWSGDSLIRISNICFVTVADVPHLSWIKAPCSSPLEINGVIKLTTLNQSVLLKYAPLVWTVKPVFEQPEMNKEESIWDREAFLKKLSVTQPSVEDIVNNLLCISNSRLANLELFDNYDSNLVCSYHDECSLVMQCPPSKLSLLDVVSQCLNELQQNLKCFEELVPKLKDCACVPVSAKPLIDSNSDPTHVVLVRPIQVVKIFSQGDNHLKPYINELPNCLANYSAVLELLGVQNTVSIVHLQYVLNMIHLKLNGGITDDPNQIGKIRKSISKLNELMSKEDYSKKEAAKHLDPLYLPFSLGKHWSLKPSNNLVFVDSARHQSRNPKDFNLVETKYSLFTIPPSSGTGSDVQDRSGIGFNMMLNERNFCKLLPKEIRPLQLSLYSYEQRLDVGSITMGDNIAIACLNKSKKFTLEHAEMPPILQNMLKYIMNLVDSEPFVQTFLGIMRNINLVSMKGLQASLYLTNENIGTLTSPKFVLEKRDEGIYEYTLYVDESQDGDSQFLIELSRSLLIEIARITQTNLTTYFKMIDSIKSFFEVRTLENLKIFAELYKIQLTLTNNEENNELEDFSLTPIAGKKIPEEFVCRLDKSITNIFNPQEWVAYEVAEEQFVWAMVLYPARGSDDNTKLDRYNIMVNDEENGIEVSVVDLYKIKSKVVHEDEVFEQALVPLGKSNGDDAESQIRLIRGSQTIMAMKEKICADLRRISNLTDETEKRKAIKRLYLLYHPDKASSNKDMFEKAFQFLLRQIEQLEQGLPLEDPKDFDESDTEAAHEPSQQWSARFHQWSSYVPRHSNTSSSRTQQATSNNARSNFDFTDYQPKLDHEESNCWLKQAHTDFEAMNILLNVTYCHERSDQESVVCQVLFLAHEVVEKSLKAGMYKLVGLNPGFLMNHELVCHARSICSLRGNANTLTSSTGIGTVSLESIASWITPFYLDSRFPNRHGKHTAPVDVYPIEYANMAADYAKTTIDFIDSL